MSVIRWEDPPPVTHSAPDANRGRVNDWAAVGAELVARPGEWALVALCRAATTAGSTAGQIRTGRYPAMARLGRFEAVSRTVGTQSRVYARFLGPTTEDGNA